MVPSLRVSSWTQLIEHVTADRTWTRREEARLSAAQRWSQAVDDQLHASMQSHHLPSLTLFDASVEGGSALSAKVAA